MPKLSVIKETENNCDNVVYINGACEMKKEIGVPENFRLKIQSSPFKCDTSAFIKNISLIASGKTPKGELNSPYQYVYEADISLKTDNTVNVKQYKNKDIYEIEALFSSPAEIKNEKKYLVLEKGARNSILILYTLCMLIPVFMLLYSIDVFLSGPAEVLVITGVLILILSAMAAITFVFYRIIYPKLP